jgi:hypothetical protein
MASEALQKSSVESDGLIVHTPEGILVTGRVGADRVVLPIGDDNVTVYSIENSDSRPINDNKENK